MAHRVTQEYTKVDSGSSNIQVSIRARPPEDKGVVIDFLQVTNNEDEKGKILIKDPGMSAKKHGEVSFQFDNVFWTDTSQEEVFRATCKIQVDHVLEGYSCCCFACELFLHFDMNTTSQSTIYFIFIRWTNRQR